MTQHLLNKSFENTSAVRRGLVEGAFERIGELDDEPVEAVSLPLFLRRGPDLVQLVRVRCRAAAGLELHLETDGGSAISSARFDADGETFVADCFVPEVARAESFRFAIGEPGRGPDATGTAVVEPQRKWSVSLIHHSHLDVGYTDPQAVVAKNHLEYLDAVLDLVDETSDWDDDARFRWNIEVTWPLERWFAARGERDRARMVAAIRSGSVGVGAMSLNMHSEACSIEELYDLVRFAVELRETHGLEISGAMQTDVPGGVTGLVEVLADAGVRYLSVAHNYAGRSIPYLIGGEALERPFYWRAPSGKRLLVWFTDTAHGNAYMEGNLLGLAEGYGESAVSLPYYLVGLANRPYPLAGGLWIPAIDTVKRPPYPHDLLHLRVQGKLGDNAPPSRTVAETVRAWNERWAFPHLRMDLSEAFLARAEQCLGGTIPEYGGDWADWWADGLGSGARMLGWARRAQDALRSARSFDAMGDAFAARPARPLPAVRAIYEDIELFDEHTWGARHPWGDDEEGWGSGTIQWQRKASFAQHAREDAESLADAAARRIGDELAAPSAAVANDRLGYLVVLNALGFARSDLVRVFVPFATVGPDEEPVVVDGRDGRRLATLVEPQEHVEHRPDGRFLRFLASDVPPCGYVEFALMAGMPVREERSANGEASVASDRYRASYSLPRASLDSIVDLDTKFELVSPGASLGANGYVWDRYATSTRIDHLSGRVYSEDLHLVAERLTADAAVLVERRSSELGESVTLDVRAPGSDRLLTTVTAWRGVDRVEIENRLWKARTVEKQSLFFAFPFNVANPKVRYELPGVATPAAAASVPGSPEHMRAIRHFIALEGPAGTVAWVTAEAALVQLGDIHSPYAPFPGTLPEGERRPGSVYSWAMNNIWDTNFPTEQGGEMRFRYAVAAQPSGDGVALGARLADAISAPLVAVLTPGAARAHSGSLCRIASPEVRLVQLGESRHGDLLVWLNNLSYRELTTRVEFPDLDLAAAFAGTVFEERLTPLELSGGGLEIRLAAGETRGLVLHFAMGAIR